MSKLAQGFFSQNLIKLLVKPTSCVVQLWEALAVIMPGQRNELVI